MKNTKVEDINKNFVIERDNNVNQNYQTYYSTTTKQWEQRQNNNVENKDNQTPEKQVSRRESISVEQQFQKYNKQQPSSINKSKINFTKIKKDEITSKPLFLSRKQIRKSFFQMQQSKSKSYCKWIGIVLLGLLIILSIAAIPIYFFYLKPNYFNDKQKIQTHIISTENNIDHNIQKQIHSTLFTLQNVMNLNFNHTNQVQNKHMLRSNYS